MLVICSVAFKHSGLQFTRNVSSKSSQILFLCDNVSVSPPWNFVHDCDILE